MEINITQIDTACMLLDINGFRILTDPVFDQAGGLYPASSGRVLKKLQSPALQVMEVGPVDLVLLSHDQHKDNLDDSGKEFIKTVPKVISTREAQERLEMDSVMGIDEWQTVAIDTDKVPGLKITGTPCQHGSDEVLHKAAGHVLGFMVEWEGQKDGALYISGDTVYFKGVEEVASRYQVDTAILHIGRAGFPAQIGDRYLTFTTEEAVRVARLMKVNKLIPTHIEGWEHFQEKAPETHARIIDAGLEDKLVWLEPGKAVTLEI